MKDWINLLRVYQYIKNLFIFLPLFFAHEIMRVELLARAGLAFVAFSMAASAVYIFNDLHDLEEDRHHPRKKDRPLAAGRIAGPPARAVMTALFLGGFVIVSFLGREAFFLTLVYVLINAGYTLKWKQVAIIDIFIIALGFVLRIFVGGAVTDVTIYPWIVIMTFFLALFLALAKRRDDLLILENGNARPRRSLGGYNVFFVQSSMVVMAAVIIVAYTMYTLSPEIMAKFHTDRLYLTTVFVLMGLLRYLQLTFVKNDSGSPTAILLRDPMIQGAVLGWILAFVFFIYL